LATRRRGDGPARQRLDLTVLAGSTLRSQALYAERLTRGILPLTRVAEGPLASMMHVVCLALSGWW